MVSPGVELGVTVDDDHLLARDLAEAAGQRLLALRQARGDGDAASLRRDRGRQSHEFLADRRARRRPADALLSEEGVDDPARLSASRVWIVDPLDGTREFGEPGRSDWAVHVALWVQGELTAGAVALPAQGMTLSTAEFRAQGAAAASPDKDARGPSAGPRQPARGGTAGRTAGAAPPRAARGATAGSTAGAAPRELRLLVSRSRPPAIAVAVAEQLGAVLVPLGSAGAKAAAVITGAADAYLHSGGQHEWDSAAPVAVARARGLDGSRIDVSKLLYSQADPSLPDILICPDSLAGMLLEAISSQRHRLE